MRAGIGKLLAHMNTHTIGAIVFTRALYPWGTALMLHSDLDDQTYEQWFEKDPTLDAAIVGELLIGPSLSRRSLELQTESWILDEAMRRHTAVHNADMLLECRNMDYQAARIRGAIGRRIVRAAQWELTKAREADWPHGKGDLLYKIANSILRELRADERCPECQGTGEMLHVVDENRKPIKCPECDGTGCTKFSDRERARSIEVNFRTFGRSWKRPYEWLYNTALVQRRAAVMHLRSQLNDDDESITSDGAQVRTARTKKCAVV